MLKKIAKFILRDELYDLNDRLGFYKRMYKLADIYRRQWSDTITEAVDTQIISHEQHSKLYEIKKNKLIALQDILLEKGLEGID